MRSRWLLGVLLSVFLFHLGHANAATVAVFDNPAFVDTGGGSADESDTIQASLISLGHSVTTFTGYTAADWALAASGADVILIPEMEAGNLTAAMSPADEAGLAAAISSGTGFISSYDYRNLINTVFAYSTDLGSGVTTSLNVAQAAGTSFAGGPASLGIPSATGSLLTSSLPTGALSIYDNGTRTTVYVADYGAGRVGFLGWDWYNAQPLGSSDGGWLPVLDRMVSHVGASSSVPEPTTIAIWGVFGGLGLIAARRRKRVA